MNCPECQTEMYKSGIVWKNRQEKVQRWRCPNCGRTTQKGTEVSVTEAEPTTGEPS